MLPALLALASSPLRAVPTTTAATPARAPTRGRHRHRRQRRTRWHRRCRAGTGAVDTVGFIFVGPKDDFGYNQAAYEGSDAVQEAFPDVTVLQAENVPETAEAEAVMQDMIDDGADLIFATSYGHLEFAANLAAENPDVVFVHQGGLETGAEARQPRHLLRHRVRARLHGRHRRRPGQRDRQARLRLRLPDPADAGQHQRLHARRPVGQPRHRDDRRVDRQLVRPGLQAQAAQSLLDQGVDVITQHQDCTKTIIEATEAAGAYSVGYHADASRSPRTAGSPARSGTGRTCTSTSSRR